MTDTRDDDAARKALEAERARITNQVQEVTADLDPEEFDEGFADSGQVAAEKGEARLLAASLREQLDDVQAALDALDEGRYGLCEVCGEPIGDARLEAMPTTRRCIQHA